MTRRNNEKGVAVSREQLIEAIDREGGIITKVAERIGVSRKTIYEWIKEHEISKEYIEECRDTIVDYAESALKDILKDRSEKTAGPRVTAAIYVTKTKGRSRGWNETSDIGEAARELARVIAEKLGPQ